MKKWILSIALALGLVVVLSFAVLAKEGEKTIRQTRIEGYGEYKLGMPVSELPLNEFEGPIKDVSSGSLSDVVVYGKKETVHLAGQETKVFLIMNTLEEKVEGVMLAFTGLLGEFGGLDSLGRYVRELRQLIIDRYDPKLKKKDSFSYGDYSSGFSWYGMLRLEDELGNTLTLLWRDYSLYLHYETARLREVVEEAEKKAKKKSEGQI